MNDSVLVITGPTASGKTALALELARADKTIEIVNADASLLYRGFDIGTAKPTEEERRYGPHHLIDILEPKEEFSAARYSALARPVIREIRERGGTPVVVGGTGFYLDALFEGLPEFEIEPETLRGAKLRAEQEIAEYGFQEMHERLRTIDPELFAQIERERNPIRLQRAWEHYYATGEALGVARSPNSSTRFEIVPHYRVLLPERAELWQRIEWRVLAMLDAGWLEEARRLHARGVTRDQPAMKAIGYAELFDVIEGTTDIAHARERIVIRTRQYAKRQATWMKRYLRDERS